MITITGTYSDVFVLSGPIYLPAKEGDGKFYMHHQVLSPSLPPSLPLFLPPSLPLSLIHTDSTACALSRNS